MDNPRKIWIVGPPGSGKTTLGKELSSSKKIDCYCLDELRWKLNWEQVSDTDFEKSIKVIIDKPEWIIDGYYPGLDEYFNIADEIVYIKMPLIVLLTRICKRSYKRIKGNIEICNGNTENWKFFFSKNGIFIYTIKQYFLFKVLFQKWRNRSFRLSLRK
ncbi:AAA family ATPase [Listeria seeligeri]|nr:AAA family ATPase [Listeria seeligeri]CBH27292.1 kinase, putative [Listeria seeligeri serovar 1/2b str. SLCC3954]MBF2345351.1 AAA family ATPase [Listeria seeligeri]MBF2435857.1 AAA family ATPase [Listeria seeligeri]MBF2480186.1 AAA family ATPase [Listeria seeligeri]